MSDRHSQLTLNLGSQNDFREEDFVLNEGNQLAHDWLASWPDWPSHAMVLYGPAASGKSHLAHLWAERAGALLIPPSAVGVGTSFELMGDHGTALIDDAQMIRDERSLFHLLNYIAERRNHLLLVVRSTSPSAPFTLPDLRSRLDALPAASMAAPDEELLSAVLQKHFADRQLRVGQDVIQYMVTRMERSFPAARALVAKLDELALKEKKNINLAFVRQLFT